MSHKTTKKKRLKISQDVSNLPKKEDSDIAKYFVDCLSFAPDLVENQSNKLPYTKEVDNPSIHSDLTKKISSGISGNKSTKSDTTIIPQNNSKNGSKKNIDNIDLELDNLKSRENNVTPISSLVAKSQRSFSSFRNNKSNVFDNITASFNSSKILSVQAFSEINSQKHLELASWGLPSLILKKYEARGISTMFPWQVECLANKKILQENKNIVYSAPTSAGKTLVAEFLMLKTVLERRKKVIFILPFVSVVREKMFYFQDLLSDSGVRVEGFMGGVAPAGGFSAVHIAIATIEKANSIINRLMEEGDLVTLGAVVIDELHLLGDPGRGYILELLLTKLRYMTLNLENVDIQLIGMSATLPNLSLIAEWLDAELYKTDFRPIPLNEQCKIGPSIFDTKFNIVRELVPAIDIVSDIDNIIQLCIETINGGHGVLIFCPTKNWCEKLSLQMASTFFQLGRDNTPHGLILRNNINLTSVQEVLAQLEHCPVGLDSVLKKTVSFGVAFHHAGLTMDERDIIEGGFRVGSLKVLMATSTLSSGVNLPARRVIIRSPIFNGKPLDKLTYQQMIGRAGRMGKDTAGESILVCKQTERSAAEKLMAASLEPIESCLENSGPLIRALLESIASQIVRTPKDLDFYSKCTFVYKCANEEVKEMVDEAVQFLISNEFLQVKDGEGEERRIVATCLGKACLAASIPPREGLFLFEELQRARKCFVLDTELHVIYLVTPFNSGSQINQIDWMVFVELWRSLSECERRVGQLVGVEERFLMSAMRGVVKPGKSLNIHRRFFTAMALHDLVREVPLNAVCRKYNCNRGLLQSLQQSSSTFAGMVTNFCKELKWDCMELLFAQFQARLQFGVSRDLLDLLRLPSLNGLRARSLYKHGITTVAELAMANELDVEEALNKALPFESEKNFDGENEAEIVKRNEMRTVFITGKDGLTAREAAKIVIKEARILVENELGIKGVRWSQDSGSRSRSNPSFPIDNPNTSGLSSIAGNRTPIRNISVEVHSTHNQSRNRNTFQNPMEVIPERANKTAAVKSMQNESRLSCSNDNLFVSIDNIENKYCKPEVIFVESDIKIVEKENSKGIEDKSKENESRNSYVSNKLSSEDVINESNKQTNRLEKVRSKLAEKTNSILKENFVTINSQDFFDTLEAKAFKHKINSPKASKQSQNKSSEYFMVSARAVDEIMQVVQEENNKRVSASENKISEGKKSLSGESNCSKSPSLFSDSSFLDAQVCSILEKNVIDSACFIDFEKSSFTQQKGETSRRTTRSGGAIEITNKNEVDIIKSLEKVPIKSLNKRKASEKVSSSKFIKKQKELSQAQRVSSPKSIKKQKELHQVQKVSPLMTMQNSDPKLISLPMTWIEDSWDQSKNLKLDNRQEKIIANEDLEWQSPSMLHTSRMRSRLKDTQATFSKLQTTGLRVTDGDIPLIGTPKSILKKRIFDKDDSERSPIKSFRTYNTRRPILPVVPSNLTKSDSEDSILSSQNLQSITVSRIRSKIEKKILYTQKINKTEKSVRTELITNIVSNRSKINSPTLFEKCGSGEEDDVQSAESGLMFDSDNTTKSLLFQSEKNDTDTSSRSNFKLLRAESNLSLNKHTDKIEPSSIQPINVANSKKTFRLFRNKIEGSAENQRRNDLAIALVTEYCFKEPTTTIGNKIIGIDEKKKKEKKTDSFVYENKKVLGIIITWGVNSVYYMPYGITQETKITIKERMGFLKDILTDSTITIRCFNAKEVYKMFYTCCEIEARCQFLDPRTGDWLMNSEACNKSYPELAAQYFPRGYDLACSYENGNCNFTGSVKASIKAVLAWYITDSVVKTIEEISPVLISAYKDIEMPTKLLLARMELRGFGINVHALQELSTVIKNDLSRIEEEAFILAGRKFNFYSSKEVSQVLGLKKKGRGCTNKNVLKSCEHPISNLVTLWRKLSTVQTKIIGPLLQLEKKNNRIHGNCITYTVTGRVSMHEPNLQTIPRDFKSEISDCVLSVRMAFIPSAGNVMLSADFCQLELRILAHFSQDPILCKLMHEQGDIFKNIAASLNAVTEEMVDDDMRQRAKQLCYAMVYGMGAKSLAETLSVTESEAKDYLEAFMGTYKGIRVWLNSVTEQAKAEGFVSTLMNRRRVLPGLNSKILAVRAQAERQAVNTKVQGSAADIAKKAMILVESKLREQFSYLPLTFPPIQTKRKLQNSDSDSRPRGAYLILQMHDELLYEVNSNDLQEVALIVKESMENAVKLRVPLPVKVKVGPAWGNLEEYKF